MSTLDDYLQHLRDAIGIKSNKQLDAEEKPSAYLSNAAQGIVETPNYDPLKHGLAGPQAPAAMPPPAMLAGDLGDAYGREPLMQRLADAERGAGVQDGGVSGGKFGMLQTQQHPQPMTEQETLDYIDFLSDGAGPGYEVTVGEPEIHNPAMAAMRRRR